MDYSKIQHEGDTEELALVSLEFKTRNCFGKIHISHDFLRIIEEDKGITGWQKGKDNTRPDLFNNSEGDHHISPLSGPPFSVNEKGEKFGLDRLDLF